MLIETLVRDHVKHSTGALNDPTILWQVETALWEARNRSPATAGVSGGADAAKDADAQGILSMILMTCRERGEDRAAAEKNRPNMRIVPD